MTKENEKAYFDAIGQQGVDFTLHKPFSDSRNAGSLLSDIATVINFLPDPPAKILDLGCGSGWTSNFYAQAGYSVTGVDIAQEAIRAATQHFTHPNLKFIAGDYDAISLDAQFDVAVFFDSLHHSDNEQLPLETAFRCLKPGGMIILCEPGRGHSASPSSKEAVEKYDVSERDMPPHISRKALHAAGFERMQTYAYPALLHRVAYKDRTHGVKKVTNIPVVRGILCACLCTVLRRYHGLVVANKPHSP